MTYQVTFDPISTFNSFTSGTGQRRANELNARQIRNSERQQSMDNRFRTDQAALAEAWNWRQWHDRGNKIQMLAADARKAGISPMAALGNAGTSPISLTIPQGQGGRVGGTYQRQGPAESMAKLQIAAQLNESGGRTEKEQAQARMYESQAKLYDMQSTKIHQDMLTESHMKNFPQLYYPQKYKYSTDNLSEAQAMQRQGYFVYLNPELNLEMPEFIGGYQFAKPYVGSEGHHNPTDVTDFSSYINSLPID